MVKKEKSSRIPRLDHYIRPEKVRHLVNYATGARLYSLAYFAFVRLAKEAGATRNIRKSVLVDIDVFEDYLEKYMDRKEKE